MIFIKTLLFNDVNIPDTPSIFPVCYPNAWAFARTQHNGGYGSSCIGVDI